MRAAGSLPRGATALTDPIHPFSARVVDTLLEPRAGGALSAAQMEAARAQFAALAPFFREEVLATLSNPSHPVADQALRVGIEQGYQAYLETRDGYSGLRSGQRVGELDLLIDRSVNITGPGRGFASLADAQTAARVVAAGSERDAAVFRAPNGTFVMHPISDLGRLGAGRNPVVHDLDQLGGYRLISIATETSQLHLADDVTQVDRPIRRTALAALNSGRPVTIITGEGVIYASRGLQPDGTYRNSVGSERFHQFNIASSDVLEAAQAGRVNAKVLFVLGCFTSEYNGRPTEMPRAFMQAPGARA